MRRITTRRGIALFSLLIVLAAGCTAQQGSATASASAEEAAEKIATLAVELGAYDLALDSGSALAWEASADALTLELGRELTEDERATVKRIFNTVLGEFLTADLWKRSVTKVYAKHFTAAELDAMVAFYDSPVGRKTLQLEGQLADAVDTELEEALDGEIDAFIERIDQSLAAEFPGLAAGEGS
jgi:hypothetical protein